jgi:hypothetical protein
MVKGKDVGFNIPRIEIGLPAVLRTHARRNSVFSPTRTRVTEQEHFQKRSVESLFRSSLPSSATRHFENISENFA